VSAELGKLAADIDSGDWARDNAALLALDERDCGYRLVVTKG
jgi:hypothetical protein